MEVDAKPDIRTIAGSGPDAEVKVGATAVGTECVGLFTGCYDGRQVLKVHTKRPKCPRGVPPPPVESMVPLAEVNGLAWFGKDFPPAPLQKIAAKNIR